MSISCARTARTSCSRVSTGTGSLLLLKLEGSQQALVRIHGDRGLMENLRHGDTRTLRVLWDAKDREDWRRAEEVFLPWPLGFPQPTPIRWATAWPRR